MASEAEKEQAKLTATYMNGIAVTIFALGCFSPVVARLYGTGSFGVSIEKAALTAMACLAISMGLHIFARMLLKRGLR